jgi:hypothetical protein
MDYEDLREDTYIESKMREDYDFCYEKIVLESDELYQIQQLIKDLADRMADYGWEDDNVEKDIRDEI